MFKISGYALLTTIDIYTVKVMMVKKIPKILVPYIINEQVNVYVYLGLKIILQAKAKGYHKYKYVPLHDVNTKFKKQQTKDAKSHQVPKLFKIH